MNYDDLVLRLEAAMGGMHADCKDDSERYKCERGSCACYERHVDLLAEAADAIQELQRDAEGCVCKGNWRKLLEQYRPMIGKRFKDHRGVEYTFFGLVDGEDDYYYGMSKVGDWSDRKIVLASCVGRLEGEQGHGFTAIDEAMQRE